MQLISKVVGLLAGLMLGASACAQQWFTVASPYGEGPDALVEIDLDSVHIQSRGGEGVIRLTLDAMQLHSAGFAYRSFVATAQFDCQSRNISLASAAYYPLPSGKGTRLGADSSGRQAGMPVELLQSIPSTAQQALLKATCASASVN